MKIFVLDTNVLLSDPQAFLNFGENSVVIPITVIEEIDRFKKDKNETGRNAKEVSRLIDELRLKGSLSHGVQLDSGGTLRIALYEEVHMKGLPPELRESRGSNRILAVAVDLMKTEKTRPVILVTKDTHLRIISDALGLVAQDYKSDEVTIDSDFVGPGSGGYIVLDLPNDKRSLFHDLLKGFEDYSPLKGYEVNFSIDATYKDKIAFKFTVTDNTLEVGPERVRCDFKEYIDKVKNGDNFDDVPMVTSFEEHHMFITAIKNRINFLQYNYSLAKNSVEYYEKLINNTLGMPVYKSPQIVVQTGGTIDSRRYNSSNSSNIVQGDSSVIEYSTMQVSVAIGDTFNSKKIQIEKIDKFINAVKDDPKYNSDYDAVVRDVEKVKDELQDEPQPDSGRVAKWLERAKQAMQIGSLGHEAVLAAKELFTTFGLNS